MLRKKIIVWWRRPNFGKFKKYNAAFEWLKKQNVRNAFELFMYYMKIKLPLIIPDWEAF